MASSAFRMERDIIGEGRVPRDALYGINTMRATENFPITGRRLNAEMIKSVCLIKKAAAAANREAGALPPRIADAIMAACDEVIAGRHLDAFLVDPVQGGAGTSANMNANEVIANLAILRLGGHPGAYGLVHPNDHVNCAQSTNDVYPSAGKLALIELLKPLYRGLGALEEALREKAKAFDGVIKMGRTQLQDAVPIRLGQEFSAYAVAVRRGTDRLRAVSEELRILNLGGTAVGTGVNTGEIYARRVVEILVKMSGERLLQADNLIDATQNLDGLVALSGALKALAVGLSKIASDLRLMSSGPRTGFGEIALPARQSGSSIMPGKVNPVIPEVINQIAFCVMGNDVTVALAAESGQLELNAFEPILFDRLFESVGMLTGGVKTFSENCIRGISADKARCEHLVAKSTGTAAALCPYIGYARASELAKTALRRGISVADATSETGLFSEEELREILDPRAMTEPPAVSAPALMTGR